MKRTLKILASVFLIAGLAAGVGISYSDSNNPDREERAARFDSCPAYATNQAIFMARSGQNWIQAAEVTESVSAKANVTGPSTMAAQRNNYIDDYLFDKMAADRIPSAGVCTDEEFLRRAYLDLTGRVPAAADVRRFLSDSALNKRARLIDSLIGTPEFLDKWTMFFGDLLKNVYGPRNGGLYAGRDAYYYYIRDFLETNKSYAQVVSELITVPLDAEAPLSNWDNGPLNFYARNWETMANGYDVVDNIATEASRVFLGVPDLCISCHSGARHLEQVNLYLSQKRRQDLWGLSAFFSGLRLRHVKEGERPATYSKYITEVPTAGYDLDNRELTRDGIRPPRLAPPEGPLVTPNYFFTAATPKTKDFRSEFARILVADPQFGRAAVNYIWKDLMGMGIVDPPDAFDLARLDPNNPPPAPWTLQTIHTELLNRLGRDFADHDYDVRYVIRLIMNSTAYQLSARFNGTWEGRYAQYFARHFVKRQTAEQVLDWLSQATGILGSYNIPGFGILQWAMQFPDTTEPHGPARGNADIRNFLDTFFRGDRYSTARTREGSILQALALMNSPMVHNRVQAGRRGLVDTLIASAMTADQIIDELFLATLSRYPTTDERALARQMIDADRSIGTEETQLILFNKLDGLFY
jgi:hypothetical protein